MTRPQCYTRNLHQGSINPERGGGGGGGLMSCIRHSGNIAGILDRTLEDSHARTGLTLGNFTIMTLSIIGRLHYHVVRSMHLGSPV